MPRRERRSDKLKRWKRRVSAANKAYERWEERYNCKKLEDYYLGRQWAEDEERDKYTINLIYPTVEIRKPSLVFHRPVFRVEPRPPFVDEGGSLEAEKARLREDTLQTLISSRSLRFEETTALCVHEAHFRFGVVEVGYAATFIDNPNAGKPMLRDGEEMLLDERGEPVLEPDSVPEDERLYLKRIPATRFRVPSNSRNALEENDWVGYYEWRYLSDVKADPLLRNTAGLRASARLAGDWDVPEEDSEDEDEAAKARDMVKVWKIWDLRARKRHIFAEGHDKFFLEDEPFDFLPFAALKFHEILDDWYPLPLVFNWTSPQDELNETREMQRVHRRRFYRRYLYLDGSIDEGELQKLETGGDGTYARTNTHPGEALVPVPDAPLDAAVVRNIPLTKEDFREISGISGEQRGVSESQTATQANIINARSMIRENQGRKHVGDWLGRIGFLILRTIEERMTLPFWIRMNTVEAGDIEEKVRVAVVWKEIASGDLGSLNYEVSVDLDALSPVALEAQRSAWVEVMGMLQNPGFVAMLGMSDVILRRTLEFYNIRSEADVLEIQRVAQQMLQMMQQGMGGGGGQAAAGETPAVPAPGDILGQLAAQVR
jgi:hypothetical protein